MIAVEFYDYDIPLQHGVHHHDYKWRSGTLLQITPTAADRDTNYMAFVIVKKMDHDKSGHAKTGETIILPVKLQYVRVKGTSIPLFGS